MLKIVSTVSLKLATDAERGNVQVFLERLLVEVISENYRYFASEELYYQRHSYQQPSTYCWPPLLANERQVSGLFATGLSRVCPISRPEHSISRSAKRDSEDAASPSKNGRIDFLAAYGARHIALELKRCPIATIGDAKAKSGLEQQWNAVSDQAKKALVHMRENGKDYDLPVSIGLLVIRISRIVTKRRDPEAERIAAAKSLPDVVERIRQRMQADFLCYYTPPAEMQLSYGWGKNKDQYRVFPGVAFAAVVHGNTR